jgi:NAD(P) transhydrogenase subunit alpha
MRLAVPREIRPDERRVALVPDAVRRLVEAGLEVSIESGAGTEAAFPDGAYEEAGASVVAATSTLWSEADILLKVAPPAEQHGVHEIERLRQGAVLVGFLDPLEDTALVRRLAEHRITAFSVELVPRLSRAQSMDVLSSQATVAGYKGALLAADALGQFFPMLTTAAGTIAPARVLVIGAGVAGLMAIATARRLGAVVEAFDIRPAVREEVQSLGATFVGVELQEATEGMGGYAPEVSEVARQHEQETLRQHVQNADVVITAAQVPGKRAPRLLTEEMVAAMRPGAVVVDLAADQGGNCACTVPGEDVVRHGVTVIGRRNLPSLMPQPASRMYARNMLAFLHHILRDGELHLDFTDEITQGACVTHDGTIRSPAVRQASTRSGRPN